MAPSMKSLVAASALLMTCFLFREGDCHSYGSKKKPNIMVIMVNDMGWNDIGAHDSNMYTPTIDMLYNQGFRMNYSYADPDGSSSRAAFYSGKFSFRLGLQDGAINKYSDAHIPLNHSILPLSLKYMGYKTHLIGQWGQGFCNKDMTPNYRGFDSFYGHYTQDVNYNTKKSDGYYDFRDNLELVTDSKSKNMYGPDVLAKQVIRQINRHRRKYPNGEHPFFIMLTFNAIQAPNDIPDKFLRRCRKGVFTSETRKVKCAMMSAVDKAVERIWSLLDKTHIDDNTVVIFTSDNGGDKDQGSSNWPLRGNKNTLWEGGIRVPSFLWSHSSALLPRQNFTYKGVFHMVDWYPTILGFAKKSGRATWPLRFAPPMDGKNHWRYIKRGSGRSYRTEFAYMVNETDKKVAYVRQGDYKMIINEEGFPGWYNSPDGSDPEEPTLDYKRRPYLIYNIKRDPTESKDLSKSKYSKYVAAREGLLDLWNDYLSEYYSKAGSAVDSSPASHPDHNNAWSYGTC